MDTIARRINQENHIIFKLPAARYVQMTCKILTIKTI